VGAGARGGWWTGPWGSVAARAGGVGLREGRGRWRGGGGGGRGPRRAVWAVGGGLGGGWGWGGGGWAERGGGGKTHFVGGGWGRVGGDRKTKNKKKKKNGACGVEWVGGRWGDWAVGWVCPLDGGRGKVGAPPHRGGGAGASPGGGGEGGWGGVEGGGAFREMPQTHKNPKNTK